MRDVQAYCWIKYYVKYYLLIASRLRVIMQYRNIIGGCAHTVGAIECATILEAMDRAFKIFYVINLEYRFFKWKVFLENVYIPMRSFKF